MKYLIRWDEDENGKKVFQYSSDKKHKNTDKRHGWKVRCNDCDISSRNGGKTLKQSNDTFLAVRSYHGSICDGELKTSKSYHATEISHSYTEVASEQTHVSTYLNVTGAIISNTEFSAGNRYLLLISALVGGSSTSGNYSHKVIHGSTDFADSENIFEPTNLRTTYMQSYNYFTVWTAIGGEDIILQHQSNNGTVGTQATTMIAIDLDDSLVEDEDWHYNSDNTSTVLAATPTFSTTNNATITIDAGDHSTGAEYLVLALGRTDIGDTSTRVYTRMERTGEATTNTNNLQKEGEDTNEFCLHFIADTYTLGNASNTFTQTSATSSGTAHSRVHSAVFALNLSKFKTFQKVFTASDEWLVTADFTQQLQTLVISPFFTSDFFLMSRFVNQNGISLRSFQYRQQINQTDAPTGQSTVTNGFTPWDADDFTQWCMPTVQNFTAGISYTIDIDGSTNSLSNKGTPVDIMILLFSFEFEKSFDLTNTGMFDVAVFGDNTQFDVAIDYFISLTDGLGISDLVSAQPSQNRFASDTVIIGDVLSVSQVLFRSITEPAVTIGADVLNSLLGLGRILNEIIPVSDSVARAGSTYNRIITESTDISDVLIRQVTNIRIITEPDVIISDLLSGIREIFRTISEPAVTIGDVVAGVKSWGRGMSEAVGITDAVSRVTAVSRVITDPSVVITDSVVILTGFLRAISETPVTISDLISRAGSTYNRVITDPIIVIGDSVSTGSDLIRIISEPAVVIGDAVNRLSVLFRSITEPSISITDSLLFNSFLSLVLKFPTRIKDILTFVTRIKQDLNSTSRISDVGDNTI